MDNNEHDIIIRKVGPTFHLIIPELGLISSATELSKAHAELSQKRKAVIESFQQLSAESLLKKNTRKLLPQLSKNDLITRVTIKASIIAFLTLWVLLSTVWVGYFFTVKAIEKADLVLKTNISASRYALRSSIREAIDISDNQFFWVELRNKMKESRKNKDLQLDSTTEAKLEILQMTLEDLQPFIQEIHKTLRTPPQIP